MIVTDAGEDPDYRWGDLSLLMQQAREDFSAEIEWFDPATNSPPLPAWAPDWINPAKLGTLASIQRQGQSHAAFARVTYPGPQESWILILKPSLSPDLTQDILNYAAINPAFPNDPTVDQVFDDIQWESYRALGQQIGLQVFQ